MSKCLGERQDLRQHSKEHVSWHLVGTEPVELSYSLPKPDRGMPCNWELSLLRPSAELMWLRAGIDSARQFCDPSLFQDLRAYGAFLPRLCQAGMLQF